MSQLNCSSSPARDDPPKQHATSAENAGDEAGALAGAAFDEKALTAMRMALDAACDRLGIRDDGAQRSAVATVILRLAHGGIQEPETLLEIALAEIGTTPTSE